LPAKKIISQTFKIRGALLVNFSRFSSVFVQESTRFRLRGQVSEKLLYDIVGLGPAISGSSRNYVLGELAVCIHGKEGNKCRLFSPSSFFPTFYMGQKRI
jgi:hypothetical protein